MCLAIPGLVEEVFQHEEIAMGKVNFGGVRKNVCLEYTPDVQAGQYVLVHVGFSLSVINEEEALRALSLIDGDESSELSEKEVD